MIFSFSLNNFLNFAKICIKILFFKQSYSLLNTFMRKGKDLEAQKHADPDTVPDPNTGT